MAVRQAGWHGDGAPPAPAAPLAPADPVVPAAPADPVVPAEPLALVPPAPPCPPSLPATPPPPQADSARTTESSKATVTFDPLIVCLPRRLLAQDTGPGDPRNAGCGPMPRSSGAYHYRPDNHVGRGGFI